MGTVARYKIVVAYDGTDYLGWQTQTNGVTVAGVLQHTFRRVFKKEIFLRAASRTDAGVHALGQVATFVTDLAIAPDRILQAWNNKLPAALHICSLESVSLSYDPNDNIL
jgi:tRNA pseudouridine38-40 synthase